MPKGEIIVPQVYEPVETSVGIIRGRDAVFLDHTHFDEVDFVLSGNINGNLTTQSKDRWLYYTLVFSGALAVQMVALDSWLPCHDPTDPFLFQGRHLSIASFSEVVGSEWMIGLGGKVRSWHKHFNFMTYDYVFDVVCDGFELDIEAREI